METVTLVFSCYTNLHHTDNNNNMLIYFKSTDFTLKLMEMTS